MSISAILGGIASLSPVYDSDVTINVREYNKIEATLSEAECPMRMLLAPDDKVGGYFAVISLGGSNLLEWQILDRLYIFPVNLDMGIENYNHVIYDYIEAYTAAVNANRCLGTTNATVSAVSFSAPYVQEFPNVPGATPFWVVDAVLTVEEYI